MKVKSLFIGMVLIVALTAACAQPEQRRTTVTASSTPRMSSSIEHAPHAPLHGGVNAHGHNRPTSRVPAFQADPASLKSLPATLAPELFTGRAREAYRAVKEIPQTIAQLPCYCYCDRGFGHKSLHSCFVDDHGAQCGICMDEAMMAYRLQKEERLTPEQIREQVIARYSRQ